MEWNVYYHDSNAKKLFNGTFLNMEVLEKKFMTY